MSLKEDIFETRSKIKYSFHMPGHKYKDIVDFSIPDLDTTEIEGTDNLHGAFSCIKSAEDRISKVYSSKKSRVLVAGSSIGIISAIYGLSDENDKILIGRDSHKSVYNACRIAKLNYITVMPELSANGLPLDYENFYEVLMEDKDIKLALITSPNYYGHIRIFNKIADELQNRSGYLIVDEAHGAHLEFTELREYSALKQGAHVVVQSAHKTLPAMTMSAMLHYSDRLSSEAIFRVDEALSIFQSSSPSYPLMISIDSAVEYMDKNRKMVASKFDTFKRLEREYFSPEKERFSLKDPFKIFLDTVSFGYSGYKLEKLFIENGIYPEFSQYNGILLYLSVFNEEKELIDLLEFMKTIEKKAPINYKNIIYPNIDKKSIKYRKTKLKYEIINVDASLGRVSMEDIIPYPPGVPLLLKGEEIDKELFEVLKSLSDLPAGCIEGRNEILNNIKVERLF